MANPLATENCLSQDLIRSHKPGPFMGPFSFPSGPWGGLPPPSGGMEDPPPPWGGRTYHYLRLSSRPFHFRRHRRQDGIHIAAGFQPEDGAAVVEQIEFDVTSAPDELLLVVFSLPPQPLSALDRGEQLCQRADDPIGLDGRLRAQAFCVCIHPDGVDTEALRHFDFPFKIVTDHPGLGCCYTQGLHCMLVGAFVRFAETMLAL